VAARGCGGKPQRTRIAQGVADRPARIVGAVENLGVEGEQFFGKTSRCVGVGRKNVQLDVACEMVDLCRDLIRLAVLDEAVTATQGRYPALKSACSGSGVREVVDSFNKLR
jgi:hypothetical protein